MNETQSTTQSRPKDKIIELLKSTYRDGMDAMIGYLEKEGFFDSPASTKFYGSYQGGLAKHILRVYEILAEFYEQLNPGKVSSPGQKPLPLGSDNIIIAALLHDVCKIGAYIGSEKPYRWNKGQPEGHALLSIERIKLHIKLTEIEELMIMYHMGVYGLNEFYEKDSWEYKTNAEYPLRGDHSKDAKMSKEESKKARYGKSLRNAWYHNPVCKLMYFADELATLEEKVEK